MFGSAYSWNRCYRVICGHVDDHARLTIADAHGTPSGSGTPGWPGRLARIVLYTYCTRGSAPHAWLARGTGTVTAFWGTAGSLGGDSRPYFLTRMSREAGRKMLLAGKRSCVSSISTIHGGHIFGISAVHGWTNAANAGCAGAAAIHGGQMLGATETIARRNVTLPGKSRRPAGLQEQGGSLEPVAGRRTVVALLAPCRVASQCDAGCQLRASSPQRWISASDGHHIMRWTFIYRCVASRGCARLPDGSRCSPWNVSPSCMGGASTDGDRRIGSRW